MLPPAEKELVLARLQRQVYLKGELVVREGDSGSSFFIVHKGRLEVLRRSGEGRVSSIGELKSGEFFGELSLLTGEPRTATIRALADSELLRLEKWDFQEILERHPNLTETLAEVVSSRQAMLVEQKAKDLKQVSMAGEKSSLSRKIREFFNLGA